MLKFQLMNLKLVAKIENKYLLVPIFFFSSADMLFFSPVTYFS